MVWFGYELDVNKSMLHGDLNDSDLFRFAACVDLVSEHKTLRIIEKDRGIPISTMDTWVHQRLKHISSELYDAVCLQFDFNKRHAFEKLRGDGQNEFR